ncbi:outer membrane autotransporter barrel protein [Pochonia chlamydosporia 170]|uniref:Outer membrane autotransporter barrel protein n=1 Tax=Pochonia chlamydosporia 170 TaxID=1380566 RepID=A0A179F2J7_METCM|nr:outer membrane autotransporter barrel protein [Pochonia chlamydosporia 170]OAQ59657.1 outer membrane autotransporter barrel protein [Pochonia chlamydosporia 170]
MAAHTLYNAFTIQATIPFDFSKTNAAVPFTNDVSTAVKIKSDSGVMSRTYHPIIDTGSCGFVISAADLPDWTKAEASKHPKGWEFLSSSKILYTGHWIPKDVYFTNANVEIKARIPILAVETRTHCPDYNRTADNGVCPTPDGGTKMPTGIRVMGVGFGREHDGMPQGTPDKNAFINIQTINGVKVSGNPKFRSGFVLTKDGVTIGLTAANTAGMDLTKLSLQAKHADARDWSQVEGCMAIDGSKCIPGPALIDTGVSQMYMTLPLGTKVRRTNPPVVDDGAAVSVQVGPAGNGRYIASEKFTVGDTKRIEEDIAPSSVRLTLADPAKNPPHVNTGRHFLRKWEVGFDSDGGYFGLRRVK